MYISYLLVWQEKNIGSRGRFFWKFYGGDGM